MAVDFSRTTRALDADGYRLVLIGLAVAILLLLAWSAWFFGSEIHFHATSRTARMIGDGAIRAEFAAGRVERIDYGQSARFLPDNATAPVPVIVTEIHRRGDTLELILVIDSHHDAGLLLEPGTTGRVRIETERLSPAQLVMRLAGGAPPGGAPPTRN